MMRTFFNLVRWLFVDDTRYVRICGRCGHIHYNMNYTLCCLCGSHIIKVSEGRAKSWQQEIRIDQAIRTAFNHKGSI